MAVSQEQVATTLAFLMNMAKEAVALGDNTLLEYVVAGGNPSQLPPALPAAPEASPAPSQTSDKPKNGRVSLSLVHATWHAL